MARINLLREALPLIVDISIIFVSYTSCGEKCSQLKTNKLSHGKILHFLPETAYPQTPDDAAVQGNFRIVHCTDIISLTSKNVPLPLLFFYSFWNLPLNTHLLGLVRNVHV